MLKRQKAASRVARSLTSKRWMSGCDATAMGA